MADFPRLSHPEGDFKFATILIVVAMALGWHTLKFPMVGSYGGVENQWYVSPALFPLALVFLLLVCSFFLFVRAWRQAGFSHVFHLHGWLGDFASARTRRLWYVVATLICYLYFYIPNIDFFLASSVFIFSLALPFYMLGRKRIFWPLSVNGMLSGALLCRDLIFDSADLSLPLATLSDGKAIFWNDILGGGAIAVLASATLYYAETWKQRVSVLTTAVIVPFVLMCLFLFLLQVPMPVEYGSISSALYYLVYDLWGAS